MFQHEHFFFFLQKASLLCFKKNQDFSGLVNGDIFTDITILDLGGGPQAFLGLRKEFIFSFAASLRSKICQKHVEGYNVNNHYCLQKRV